MAKVLVFSPHPDDDVIGCGGSIIKHVKAGNTVEVAYVTSGGSGSLTCPQEKIAAIREYEASKAAKLLGVSATHFLRQADGYLDFSRESVITITTLLRQRQPDIVYIPPSRDSHHDHRITHALVAECCLRAGSPRAPECGQNLWGVGTILCYEVGTPLQQIHYIEDISDYIEQKIEALRMHKSQLLQLEYDEAVRSMNRLRGITTGKGAYCECFEILQAACLF